MIDNFLTIFFLEIMTLLCRFLEYGSRIQLMLFMSSIYFVGFDNRKGKGSSGAATRFSCV